MIEATQLTAIARQLKIMAGPGFAPSLLSAHVGAPETLQDLSGSVTSSLLLVNEPVSVEVEWSACGPTGGPSRNVVPLDVPTAANAPAERDGRRRPVLVRGWDNPAETRMVGEEQGECQELGAMPRLDALVVPDVEGGEGAGAVISETHWLHATVQLSAGGISSEKVALVAIPVPVTRLQLPTVMVGFMHSFFNPSRGIAIFSPNELVDPTFVAKLRKLCRVAASVLDPVVVAASLVASQSDVVDWIRELGELLLGLDIISHALEAAPGVALMAGDQREYLNNTDVWQRSWYRNDVEVEDELCALLLLSFGTKRKHWRAWIGQAHEGGNLTVSTSESSPITVVPQLPTDSQYSEAGGDLKTFSVPPGQLTVRHGTGFRDCLSSYRWEDRAPDPA